MRLNLLLGRRPEGARPDRGRRPTRRRRPAVDALVDAIDKDVETIFRQALAALSKTDMHVYLTYADHLRYRGKRDRCLEVVDQALKSPLATLATSAEVVMGLHAVAVEAALADGKDAERFDKAAPHIKDLIASTTAALAGVRPPVPGGDRAGAVGRRRGARRRTGAAGAPAPPSRSSGPAP